MIGQTFVHVSRPIAARFDTEREAGFIKARFKPIKRIGMANRFTDDREIIGIATRHGTEDSFNCVEGFFAPHKPLAFSFRDNHNSFGFGHLGILGHENSPFAGGSAGMSFRSF